MELARHLWRDRRGGVSVETLVALPIVLLCFLGVYQLTLIYSAHLVTQRAASAAARAAAVFLADDSGANGGEGGELYAVEAARRVLLAAPGFDARTLSVTVSGDRSGFALLTATVRTRVRCTVFALEALCGSGLSLSGHAALPIQSDGGS